ncbi:MAG: NAD-dependent 4,6-dehydratase LegB [Syntrophomonadaceae bacterium]|nr:NAD-dependent 4,6-dehydratase LegB [Syntrophomonadaceae bacterium]
MDLRNKKILVTGAGGFIGSHLTEELLGMGYEVRALVRYNSLNSWGWLDHAPVKIQKKLEVFYGDIRDPFIVNRAVKGCSVVIHLAALISIPYSYYSPDSYVETNIRGTLNILQAARHLGVEKLVHTSTSEVYGTAQFVPIDEKHPLQGKSPYSATKIAADELAKAFYYSFDTPISIIRPFNTYGPRQSARAVIPTIISQIASGQKEVRLGALNPTRDFTYIKDTVRGFISVAESDAAIGEVINIGSSYEISIADLVRITAEIMQTEIKIIIEGERLRPDKGEVERLLADNAKARDILGWEPEYAGPEGLKRGLKETIDWFRKVENLKKYRPGAYNI